MNKSATQWIRSYLDNPHSPPQAWGLDIVRCTYTSQERFEEFMTLITADAVEYLERKGAEDLLETFQLKVIEDEALDGATWKTARKRFDEKVWEDLDRTPENIYPSDEEYLDSMSERERIECRVATRHNWEFFIFVGKEEVDSVVDCTDDREKKRGAGYFVTMVQSDLAMKDMECEDERGIPVDDCEQHEDCRMALFQRFKAWQVVPFFASVLNQDWYEGYEIGEDGISTVMRV